MTEAEIRAAHPDWTDEQVAEEVARQSKPDPTPAPSDRDDAAMARMRREKEQAEKDAKDAREALAERDRKEAEEQGRWEQLAKEEQAKREKLEEQQREGEQRRNAERSAGDLKFKDTGYALYLLQQDRVDLADAAAVRTALEGLAEHRQDLVTGTAPPPSGGPAGGSKGDPPKLTREQLQAMSPQQINKLDPAIVNAVLAG